LLPGEVHKLYFGTEATGNTGEHVVSSAEEIPKKFKSSMETIERLFSLQASKIQTLQQEKVNAEKRLQVETDKALAKLVLSLMRFATICT
jgi:hypothetical protein